MRGGRGFSGKPPETSSSPLALGRAGLGNAVWEWGLDGVCCFAGPDALYVDGSGDVTEAGLLGGGGGGARGFLGGVAVPSGLRKAGLEAGGGFNEGGGDCLLKAGFTARGGGGGGLVGRWWSGFLGSTPLDSGSILVINLSEKSLSTQTKNTHNSNNSF